MLDALRNLAASEHWGFDLSSSRGTGSAQLRLHYRGYSVCVPVDLTQPERSRQSVERAACKLQDLVDADSPTTGPGREDAGDSMGRMLDAARLGGGL